MTMTLINNPKLQNLHEELHGEAYLNTLSRPESVTDTLNELDKLVKASRRRIQYTNYQAQQACLRKLSQLTGHGNHMVALRAARKIAGQPATRNAFTT